jgi:23S rRNA-/tRNA-specific pseudouridylate synthase
MHQLRVHLQAIAHPIVGDRAYGGPRAPRLMLHAERLVVPHPRTRVALEIRSRNAL